MTSAAIAIHRRAVCEPIRMPQEPLNSAPAVRLWSISVRRGFGQHAHCCTRIVRRRDTPPIIGEPGWGYILEDGFDMPPLMLNADELDAAILGANWVASRGEPELARAAQNLIAKIEAIIPAALIGHIREPSTRVAPAIAPAEPVGAAKLRNAIQMWRKIELTYVDDKGDSTHRTVCYDIAIMAGFWLPGASCEVPSATSALTVSRMRPFLMSGYHNGTQYFDPVDYWP